MNLHSLAAMQIDRLAMNLRKTKVISVRLKSLTDFSPKCYKATAWDGSSDLIPKSQVFGQDYEVQKSEAYWIAEWILKDRKLQHTTKKTGWYNPSTSRVEPEFDFTVEKHIPEPKQAITPKPDADLIR